MWRGVRGVEPGPIGETISADWAGWNYEGIAGAEQRGADGAASGGGSCRGRPTYWRGLSRGADCGAAGFGRDFRGHDEFRRTHRGWRVCFCLRGMAWETFSGGFGRADFSHPAGSVFLWRAGGGRAFCATGASDLVVSRG